MRKLLSMFCYPLTWIFLSMLAGLAWRRRRVVLISQAVLLTVATGYPWLPDALMRSLTEQYPAVAEVDSDLADIVVLASGGFSVNEDWPINSRFGSGNWDRFLEGVRLHRALPDSRIWVSVPRPADESAARVLLAQVAALVGLDEDALRLFVGARTTGHEAELVRGLLAEDTRFYLVTHDSHMPRSMMLFERYGFAPVAAPVLRHVSGAYRLHEYMFPMLSNFEKSQRALHEYFGMLAFRIGEALKFYD